ncbi:hypothetical protein QQ045_017298 [Rhodiola kirilowii]
MHPPSIGNDDSPRALWSDREIVVVISESSERRGEWKKRGEEVDSSGCIGVVYLLVGRSHSSVVFFFKLLWNLDFAEDSEQSERCQELASCVDEALGFMVAAELTVDHPIMTTTDFWTSHECLLLPYL